MAFSGVITAMATPFEEDGSVDLEGCRRLARRLTDEGSDGLVLAGTTGESPTLDDAEKLAILEAVREELGEAAQLIVGTGSNDTRHSVELTRAVERGGADGALVVTPYYNKPNAAGIRAHFEAIAAGSEIPLIVYNIPSRCVVNIPPDGLASLAEIDQVVAVKQANSDQLGEIPGLAVLAGDDNSFLRCLERGGAGGILVASHLVGPRMREIFDAAHDGDLERARAVDAELQPLYEALAVATNPIPLKAALAMLGICSDRMRLPMVPASEHERSVVADALQQLELVAAT
jgi:4-hydroxy-tetrahydrodipicolinate synthase